MDSPKQVQTVIGEKISSLREGRGMSLSALAQQSGLSKGIISTLEDGRGNPTINTVWRLAEALGVPFGELTRQEADGSRKRIETEGISVQLIEQGRVEKFVETYLMQLASNILREAEPHPWGVEERVLVARGLLFVGESACSGHLQPGEDILFRGDRPHFYQSGQNPVTAVVTITYPSATPRSREEAPSDPGGTQG